MLRRTLLFSALVFGLISSHSLLGQTSGPVENALTALHPADRITSAIDDQQTVVLTGNRHPSASAQFDTGAAPAEYRMERMVLALQSDAGQKAAIAALIAAQRTPGSPYYHQWISPEQYAAAFGASSSDTQQITAWLSSHGLEVEEVTPGGRSIIFSGTAGQVESTFHTQIHTYQVGGQLHYANATDPAIPAALSGVVAGIVSMNDFHSRPMHSTVQAPLDQSSSGRYITPADFSVIYDLAPLYGSGIDGTGQTWRLSAGRTSTYPISNSFAPLMAYRSTTRRSS